MFGSDAFKNIVQVSIFLGALVGLGIAGIIYVIGHFILPHLHILWK
jgi:hypothetical protein